MIDTYKIVREFEAALCAYTGATFAVTTTSCTMAILLACAWMIECEKRSARERGAASASPLEFSLPNYSYVSVPQSIIHAGGKPTFRRQEWEGAYQLEPYPVWDCARRFTSSMYVRGQYQCVSFHWTKILGIQQGGAILHDDPEGDKWFRRARFDGRTEGLHPMHDHFTQVGWHCYMSPETAAAGLIRLAQLKTHNRDLPNDDYPDLSRIKIFQEA